MCVSCVCVCGTCEEDVVDVLPDDTHRDIDTYREEISQTSFSPLGMYSSLGVYIFTFVC